MILIPNLSVGNIIIGDNIDNYLSKYNFDIEICAKDDVTNWDEYIIANKGIILYVENGVIVTIAVEKEIIYNGKNLIGQSLSSFEEIVKSHYDGEDSVYLGEEEVPHKVYEYYSLGLQVWVKDSIVDCIYCDANSE